MIKRRGFVKGAAAFGLAGAMQTRFSTSANAMDAFSNAKAAGFKVPEESAPHERTFMQWPVSLEVYGSQAELSSVQETIALIANTIVKFEPVVMLAERSHHAKIRKMLDARVALWNIGTDDLWCRDSGPLFLLSDRGELAASNLNFNGWGDKQIHFNDGKVAERLCEHLGVKLFNNGLVGESGGVEFDGVATLIAHESSWVNPNRNSGTREDVERLLLEAYGAQKVIWAPGIAGKDITDYHIDSLVRFSQEGVIFIQLPEQMDPYDPWSKAAFETMAILQEATDATGKKFEIIDITSPLLTRVEDEEFVAAYPNYYVCNGAVICAEFGDDEADTIARRTLEELYPDRIVISLNIDALGKVGGGIHCATQQQPVSKRVWQG